MPIPDFESVILPVLEFHTDGKEHRNLEINDYICDFFKLTTEERNTMQKEGRLTIIANRVSWSRTYLKNAILLEYISRGITKITPRGLEILAENPERIDTKFLKRFPEYVEFKNRRRKKEEKVQDDSLKTESRTPEEMLGYAYSEMKSSLAEEILDQIMLCSP